jgi:hypothetical protein
VKFLYTAVTGPDTAERLPFLAKPDAVDVVGGQKSSSTVPPCTVHALVLHQDCCVHENVGVEQGGRGIRVDTISSCGLIMLTVLVLELNVVRGPTA